MIPREDARAIVYGLDSSRLVRLAYRAASAAADAMGEMEDGAPMGTTPFRVAAVMLDLDTGAVRVKCWHDTDPAAMPLHLVTLAYAGASLVESIGRRYSEGCELPQSREVLEECVARDAADDGIGVSWHLFERQLRMAYDDFDPDFEPDELEYNRRNFPEAGGKKPAGDGR